MSSFFGSFGVSSPDPPSTAKDATSEEHNPETESTDVQTQTMEDASMQSNQPLQVQGISTNASVDSPGDASNANGAISDDAKAVNVEARSSAGFPNEQDPSQAFARSDEPSPTSTPDSMMVNPMLQDKQDSFLATEELSKSQDVSTVDRAETAQDATATMSCEPHSVDNSYSSTAVTPRPRSPNLGHSSSLNDAHFSPANLSVTNSHGSSRFRARDSQPSNYPLFSAVASADPYSGPGHDNASLGSGSRTAGNSPSVGPNFLKAGPSPSAAFSLLETDSPTPSNAFLHLTQREAPKETNVADVDVDPISGRKLINQYEIISELGRGVHGKVKLGRNLTTDEHVAIKIVDRSPRRRRLGKTGDPAEKIKREIAILKKARHPNIVSLLEVIDDPAKRKVYIVLEHVEMGEIRWRSRGPHNVCLAEYRYVRNESRNEDDLASSNSLATSQVLLDSRLLRKTPELERQDVRQREGASENASGTGGADSSTSKIAQDCFDENLQTVIADTETHLEISRRHDSSNGPSEATPADISSKEAHWPHQTDEEPSSVVLQKPSGSLMSQLLLQQEDIPENFQYVPTMSLPSIREAFRDTVLGLEYLHYQGVIHRDIKPANLLQTGEHKIKISDFGVSFLGRQVREGDTDETAESDAQDFDEAVELAKTVGTPAFFAPELCQTDLDAEATPVNEQIDVWALGVTLYCLVYGRVPFYDVQTYALMRKIAKEEVHIPKKRLIAVDGEGNGHEDAQKEHASVDLPSQSQYDSIHEEVDDDLRELIRRLLVKDSRKRITLAEVKRHPWILKDVGDPTVWVDETDPSHQTQGKRIEVSKEDVADAVVPLTIIERVRSGFRKLGGALGLNRSSSRRKRADSSGPLHEHIPTVPETASISAVAEQFSMERTIRASFADRSRARERHSPLNDGQRTVRNLKDAKAKTEYFSPPSISSRPAAGLPAYERRVSMPTVSHRARSSVSSSTFIRPPPLTDSMKYDESTATSITNESFQQSGSPSGNAVRSALREPDRRFLRSVRSREKRSQSQLRQSDQKNRPKRSVDDLSEDQRAEASVAFSKTHAEGHVDAPPAGRKSSFGGGNIVKSSPSPRPIFINQRERHGSSNEYLSVSRKSSASSQLSPEYASGFPASEALRYHDTPGSPTKGQIGGERYQNAQNELLRNLITDDPRFVEAHTSASRQQIWGDNDHVPCPPSPDDNSYGVDHEQPYGHKGPSGTHPNSYASRWQDQFITPSSSTDQFASGVSQSTSNPSIPSVPSASSSIIPEEKCACEEEGSILARRSSDDTLRTKATLPRSGSKAKRYLGGQKTATRAEYDEDADDDNNGEEDDDDDDEDEDDDDYIQMNLMNRRRSTGQALVHRGGVSSGVRMPKRRLPRSGLWE